MSTPRRRSSSFGSVSSCSSSSSSTSSSSSSRTHSASPVPSPRRDGEKELATLTQVLTNATEPSTVTVPHKLELDNVAALVRAGKVEDSTLKWLRKHADVTYTACMSHKELWRVGAYKSDKGLSDDAYACAVAGKHLAVSVVWWEATVLMGLAKAYGIEAPSFARGAQTVAETAEALRKDRANVARSFMTLYSTGSLARAGLPKTKATLALEKDLQSVMARAVAEAGGVPFLPRTFREEYRGHALSLRYAALTNALMREVQKCLIGVLDVVRIGRSGVFATRSSVTSDALDAAVFYTKEATGLDVTFAFADIQAPEGWEVPAAPAPASAPKPDTPQEQMSFLVSRGIVNHCTCTTLLQKHFFRGNVVTCNKQWYVLNEKTCLWTCASTPPVALEERVADWLLSALPDRPASDEPSDKRLYQDAVNSIGSMPWRKGLMSAIYARLHDETASATFDTNEYIFAFSCGTCVDLSVGPDPRALTPEDRVTLHCGYPYPSERSDEDEARVKAWLASMFTDQEEADALRRVLAYQLPAAKPLEIYLLLTGGAANGKSTVQDAMMAALGGYYLPWDASAISTRHTTGQADPQLIASIGRRFIVVSEPPDGKGEAIDYRKLKAVSGGDTTLKRLNHGNDMRQVKLCAGMAILANRVPVIEGLDEAGLRRLFNVEMPLKFVANPTRAHERKRDNRLKDAVKSACFRDALILLLIDTYCADVYGIDEMPVPKRWQMAKADRVEESNAPYAWFKAHYEVDGVPDHCMVAAQELWEEWRASDESLRANLRGETERKFHDMLSKAGITKTPRAMKRGTTWVAAYKGVVRRDVKESDEDPAQSPMKTRRIDDDVPAPVKKRRVAAADDWI